MRYKKGNRWRNTKDKLKYITWRKVVFQLNKGRYGSSKHYVCQKCKKKRKTTRTMHAHHHYSWHHFPDKRYDKHNGVVMCIKCHSEKIVCKIYATKTSVLDQNAKTKKPFQVGRASRPCSPYRA